MTRISSLIVASTLAILPIGAFAQPATAPAKTSTPTTVTTSAPTSTQADAKIVAPVNSKPAAAVDSKVTAPTDSKAVAVPASKAAKPDVKTQAADKNQVHGMNTVNTHHAKTVAPSKS
jgi:hypothetical protein